MTDYKLPCDRCYFHKREEKCSAARKMELVMTGSRCLEVYGMDLSKAALCQMYPQIPFGVLDLCYRWGRRILRPTFFPHLDLVEASKLVDELSREWEMMGGRW